MGQLVAGMRFRQMNGRRQFFIRRWLGLLVVAFSACGGRVAAQAPSEAAKKLTWHTLEFAIVRYNDNAPNSWNIYHSEKKGCCWLPCWKGFCR